MSIRKCIYTNKEAKSKDSVIPRQVLGDEIHNWAVQAPANHEYLTQKLSNIPSELEMQANEYFHLLELAKLRVKYFETKLSEVQAEILKDYKEPPKSEKPQSVKIKEKQIEKAIAEKTIIEASVEIDEIFKKKKRSLFEDEE